MAVAYQQAQKQRYRITLDLSVFGDFDPHQIDWEKLFKLEPAEKCDAYVEDLSTPDRWWGNENWALESVPVVWTPKPVTTSRLVNTNHCTIIFSILPTIRVIMMITGLRKIMINVAQNVMVGPLKFGMVADTNSSLTNWNWAPESVPIV